MMKAFQQPKSIFVPANQQDRILVVGLGPASLTVLRELRASGFTDLSVVAFDEEYGGKCVNLGCMPFEFILTHSFSTSVDIRNELKNFVSALREDIYKQFLQLDVNWIKGQATHVEGRQLHLHDGRAIDFDRLILALGSDFSTTEPFAACQRRIEIGQIAKIPHGKRLCIHAHNNPSALGFAAMARHLGLEPTVLLSGRNPLAALPSFRYFIRDVNQRAGPCYEDVVIHKVSDGRVEFRTKSRLVEMEFDYCLCLGKPQPRFIKVDGQLPSLFEIDLTCGSTLHRPDVVYLGDGGGTWSAAEAELQAKMLVRSWRYGVAMDLTNIERSPISIHGEKPLALVGSPWTILGGDWREIDFRSIGWTKIHLSEGKIWYQINKATKKVVAIHICHKKARELAALATLLLEHPVEAPQWQLGYVHPSAAEIFKILADDARLFCFEERRQSVEIHNKRHEFFLPEVVDMDVSDLPAWIDEDQWRSLVLAREPLLHAAILYGVNQACTLTGRTAVGVKIREEFDSISLEGGDDFEIKKIPDAFGVEILCAETQVVVNYYK